MAGPSHDNNLQPCTLIVSDGRAILRLNSADGTNTLGCAVIREVLSCLASARSQAEAGTIQRLIIAGNEKFFSAGADLNEVALLNGPQAREFSRLGQTLMQTADDFPLPVIAAISGYCMGGGMDLALACDYRVAAPNAVFGHLGASLGLMTGWGGTQRLPRLIGKARAMQMFVLAEKINAEEARRIGLVDAISEDPISAALRFTNS